mgnify:CR=1
MACARIRLNGPVKEETITDTENGGWKGAGDDLPRMIQEALALLGKTASANELADRVGRLDLGCL